jgi:hypothetical protein
MARWKQDYDKALFGKLRGSEKKRAALEFLRCWYNAEIHDLESADVERVTITVPLRIVYLAPLLVALNGRDGKFFKGVAEAMKILESYSMRKRVLELKFELASRPSLLTWKEINQKYFPGYKGSPQNFQKYLREGGIDFKPVGVWRVGKERVQIPRKNIRLT